MSNYVGTIKGDFSVDSNGGALYSIPIQVPPGTAKLMPQLAVTYNSGGGNDLLGLGWSLQGLSVISRSAATIVQDGFIGVVGYDTDDRFSLDGQRLVPVTGHYGEPSAIYHTEIESWQKVVPIYNNNVPGRSGPDAFLVISKDGKLMEYGTSPDAQTAASSENASIRVWALNKVTDLNGNYLTITYQVDTANGYFYPSRIEYTGNQATNLSPQRCIQFTYENRPDTVPHYLGGYKVEMVQRLARIETFLDDQLVMSYRFAYQQGQATGRSQLVAITQADAGGVALQPTTFVWQDGDPAIFAAAQSMPSPSTAWGGTLLPMDVNGDGLIDLVNAYSSNGYLQMDLLLAKPDGSGFAEKVHLPATGLRYGGTFLPMDVNGDGCIDLVYAVENNGYLGVTVMTAAEVNGQWSLQAGPINGAASEKLLWGGSLLAMDVDGDGLTDLVYITNNGGKLGLKVLFSNGTSFAPSDEDQTAPTVLYGGQCFSADFNGDGMADLIYAYNNNNSLGLTLFLSNGRSGLIQQTTGLLPPSTKLQFGGSLLSIDLNGDGRDDLVYAYENNHSLQLCTLISNGVSLEPQPVQNTGIPYDLNSATPPIILPMEVNGDGLPDLVIVANQNNKIALNVMLSTGTGFRLQTQARQALSSYDWGGSFLPLDLNGNGKTDILYAIQSSAQTIFSRAQASGAYPDLLTAITNGLGARIEIAYKPLTDPSVYQKSSRLDQARLEAQGIFNNQISGATFPLPKTSRLGGSTPGSAYATRTEDFPRYVVSGYAKSDGRGNQYDYGYVQTDSGYFYTGAKMDLRGRGWLGYESIASPDNNLQTTTVTKYNQDFPLTNTASGSIIYRSSDRAMMKATAMSYTPPVKGADIQTVLMTAMQTRLYNFAPAGAQPDSSHLKTYAYDDYGNATATADISSDEGSQPLYIFESYSNNTDQWRLGYKTESKKSSDSAGNQIITWEQLEYDPDTQNLTAHRIWDDQNEQWLVSTFGYDEYGNRTTSTDPSGAQGTTAFDPTYHSFIVQSISPANESGERLVNQFDYWWQFGTQKSKTAPVVGIESDAGPIIWQQNIDGLGRVIEMLGPDPSNHLVALVRRSWNSNAQGDFEETLTRRDWQGEEWQWDQQYFDGLERVYRSVTLGPDGSTPVIVDKTLDSMGNPTQQSLPYYEGQRPSFIKRTYDNYEQLIEEVKPIDGGGTATTTWNYVNSNQIIQTYAAGTANARQMALEYCTYNSERVIIKRTDADGGVTTFSYDALGRLVSSVDPIGVTNRVTYDSLDRQTLLESKSADRVLYYEAFSYDDLNRTLTHQDALRNRIVVHFDALKRMISKTVGSQRPTLFVYDDADQANSAGRLASVTMPDDSSYRYAYDLYGNQTMITLNLDNQSYSFQKTYTPMRQVEQLTYPDHFAVTNRYNAANQLTAVVPSESGGGNPDVLATFSQFTSFGQAQAVTYGNSVQDLFTFNDLGQLKSQALSGAGDTPLIDTTFDWDNLDQLVAINDQLNPQKSQAFTYDAVGRLAQMTGDFTTPQVFAYDCAGNLTLKDGITYTHDGYQVRQGMQNGETVFGTTYDADGNMTSTIHLGTTTMYEYDQERQLIRAGATSFTYDYTGRRLIKRTTDGPTTYYVSPHYDVTIFPDGSSQHTKNIVGKNGLIATITTVDSGQGNPSADPFAGVPVAGTFYFHKNQIDSTTVQTDERGRASTTVEYYPFGEIRAITGLDTFRQKFTGKEMDSETGLYYFRARYYHPVIGRFITADDQPGGPLHKHDVFNRYAYVLNNPVTSVDPTGHSVLSSSRHFFTKSVSHFVSHDVKGFFTGDVKHAFTNKTTETVLSYTIDGALIVGGGVIIGGGTAIGAGPAATILGSTLLGAGLGGLTYNLSHQNWKTGTVSGNWSWGQYGANVGIGAMSGLITGGVAAGAGGIVGAAGISGVGRVAAMTAAYTFGGALDGFAEQIATNSLDHQSLWSGVGGATLIGGLLGGAGALCSEGVAAGLSRNIPAEEYVFADEFTPHWEGSISRIQGREVVTYLPETTGNKFLIALPRRVFSGIGGVLVAMHLQPDW